MMAMKNVSDSGEVVKVAQARALTGFNLSEAINQQGAVAPAHSHAQAHVTLFLGGDCRETYMGRTRTLGLWTVAYFHPGESHALQFFGEPFRTFDIELNHIGLSNLLERPLAPTTLLDNRSNSVAWLMA
jgi:quercetin dioxygenase-like cupin family protein